MNQYLMQVIKSVVSILFLCLPVTMLAQTNWFPQGSKEYRLLDRLDIKMQAHPELRFNTAKPFPGKKWVAALADADSAGVLTMVDRANMLSALAQNSEYVENEPASFLSKKPWFNTFYKQKANFFEVKNDDFFLAVNPILQLRWMKETDNDESLFQNTRGITIRGLIGKKIAFSTYMTENQERGPSWFMERIARYRAVPGVGFYKSFRNTAVDYFDARGSISFNAAKFIDLQFGYDKQFIGNGYRSLFLSDFANNQLFFKINTRIWKFNYQNLFMELTPQYLSNPRDELLSKKYAAMHHLSLQATRWLNIGLFESVVFGRKDHFDFTYLNPIIFLRSVEQQNGSADNGIAGFDFKANIAKRIQVYGQLALDELKISELTGGNGWWGNKWGIQLGGKYVDAFGVNNLDLQVETNIVRPFTYSFRDSVASHNHYNQPLAHPLGANFKEVVGIASWQPAPKWRIDGKVIYALQGIDTAGLNFGSNIFNLYTTRPADYGFQIGDAVQGKTVNASLWLSYEAKENVFLEAGLVHRKLNTVAVNEMYTGLKASSTMVSVGLRMNMFRREYDY